MYELRRLMSLVLETHKAKGFFDWFESDQDKLMADLAEAGLFCSEVGELQEALRKGQPIDEECADIAIRLFNFCSRKNVDLGLAIILKNRKNETREHRHGDI